MSPGGSYVVFILASVGGGFLVFLILSLVVQAWESC